MEQNQNKEQSQTQSSIPVEVKDNSENTTSETSVTLVEAKEQTLQTAQAEIKNLKPETDSMEVHKHPHHVMHKKKWGEYLLEFFMLFLAVFLGFVAENIREHQVEKGRAKEFARLLTGDLAADTSELERGSHVLERIIASGDSLGNLLAGDAKKITGGKLYYHEYWSGWQWSVISQDATLQQLKAAGALRYFSTDLVRELLDYEQSINVIYLLQNKYVPEKTANWNLIQKIFNQSYFNSLDSIKEGARDSSTKRIEITDPKLIRFLNTNYPLLSYDKSSLDEIRNWAYNSSRAYRTTRKDIDHAKEKAKELIELLNKDYSFTDD